MEIFQDHSDFRQRIILSTLSGKAIKIEKIREKDEEPGLLDYEINYLRLIEKITNGCEIEVNKTGTKLIFKPGLIIGGNINHKCGKSRPITYFLEGIACLIPFGKKPSTITLTGITNAEPDISIDTFSKVTIENIKKFGIGDEDSIGGNISVKINKRATSTDEGEVVFNCPIVKKIEANSACGGRKNHQKGKMAGNSVGYGVSLIAKTNTKCLYGIDCFAHSGEVAEDLGKKSAIKILTEISISSCVDSTHQWIMLLFMALCPQDVSQIKLGKLSPYTISWLRGIRQFLGVLFKIKTDPESQNSVFLSCVGSGLTNISKRNF
ncbi:RNA 3'-terminal phosphate cyclase-like protein [Anaeramoeba ignava]|uniref:RNA 3'-terminal phosphate cyclase-like protein n=1 Tax=Anaeramoeba ignava TaxID=1746090 RepID=A0A9Q0REG6_ANAIG|nr:RNA 3'-terminal phosphate cyclase-like protein [Anaeramoeba ignava]